MANMAIGSRPKEEYEKKLVGLVDVVTGKTKAKFTLTEEGKKFKNGETSLTAALDDLPSRPKLKTEQKEPKQYRIRMSQDGSEIEAITPAMGHFHAKLTDLGKRDGEDADPVPYTSKFKNRKTGEWEDGDLEFWAEYVIQDGAFKGVQLPAYKLRYKFEEDPEHEGYTRFAGNFDNKKSTRLFQLRDWGNVHGLWNEPIEWDDVTILPELLERALKNDNLVDLTIKDGYIRELLPVEQEEDEYLEVVEKQSKKVHKPVEEDDLDEAIEKVNAHVEAHKPAKKIPSKRHDDDEL